MLPRAAIPKTIRSRAYTWTEGTTTYYDGANPTATLSITGLGGAHAGAESVFDGFAQHHAVGHQKISR